MRPGNATLILRVALTAALCFGMASPSRAEISDFRIQVSSQRAVMGDSIQCSVTIETDQPLNRAGIPTPDFGGLRVEGGPAVSQRTTYVNGVRSETVSHTWQLAAPYKGEYVIGPVDFTYDGKTYTAEKVVVRFDEERLDELPESLRSEPIVHPRTNDARQTQELRGRLFLRVKVSNETPYVGEPFVASWFLYIRNDGTNLQNSLRNVGLAPPEFGEMLSEKVYQATQINLQPEEVDGVPFIRALLYQAVLTPTQPGRRPLEEFTISFLLVSRQSRSFFSDPFMRDSIRAEARTGRLEIDVMPLPTQGVDPAFGGTVGSFNLKSEVDKTTATEDDVINLRLTLEGSGNLKLAAVPTFPENRDFVLFEDTQSVDQRASQSGLSGRKVMEYLIRPTRSGRLTIPRMDYVIFDPVADSYRKLTSESREIQITSSTGSDRAVVYGGEGEPEGPPPALDDRPGYIMPVIDMNRREPGNRIESVLYWLAQILVMGAAGALFLRKRAAGKIDPALARRSGAQRAMERRLAEVRTLTAAGSAREAAAALERSLRGFVADRHNLSPDGLTGDKIGKMLSEEGVESSRVRRFVELINQCATVQYSPGDPPADRITAWADEAVNDLVRDLK